MADIITHLIGCGLQPSSVATYQRAWRRFCEFYYSLFPASNLTFPISPTLLALFISYLYKFQYASSTVDTYVSALGYHQKLLGFPDPSKVFYVTQMLKGYRKSDVRLDSRLPVTLPVLHRILDASPQIFSSVVVLRFKAMCALAFHAFLRVGELTVAGKRQCNPPLQFHDIQSIVDSSGKVIGIKVNFSSFKHNYTGRPFSLLIYRNTAYCPVQLLLDYLALRGNQAGALFLNVDGHPLSRAIFVEQLSLAFKFCGFDPQFYKGHSFRIGAATLAAHQGFSDAQIRLMGRWKSDSFKKYIRVESLISS